MEADLPAFFTTQRDKAGYNCCEGCWQPRIKEFKNGVFI